MRSLRLKKETLPELSADDLAEVVGGITTGTCGTGDCIPTQQFTCIQTLRPCP
ncbi:MAG TPA: hypothetical protein VFQ85_13675 [Mycobacteriales bacterium]|jgi:hypothetical protein|nr:hypothetical protein [Mycobacteriales bacterium]